MILRYKEKSRWRIEMTRGGRRWLRSWSAGGDVADNSDECSVASTSDDDDCLSTDSLVPMASAVELSRVLAEEADRAVAATLCRGSDRGVCTAFHLHTIYQRLIRDSNCVRLVDGKNLASVRRMCRSLLKSQTSAWDRCRIEAELFMTAS